MNRTRRLRVVWLGGWQCGPHHGYWHGEGRQFLWMFDFGPIRIVKGARR